MTDKCRFYDDGHGNGSYCSGASCGPPSCSIHDKKYTIPKCNGNILKCEVMTTKKLTEKFERINTLEIALKKELKNK